MADASSALRKLQSGQTLTDAEKKLLGLSITTTSPNTSTAQAQKFESPVEAALGRDIGSSVNYNAMIDTQVAQAQSVAAKPIMSQAQIDGGGVVKWIGGVSGEYQIVMPIGSPLVGSTSAGWEPGRNRVGVTSGVSPTGIIPGSGSTVTGNTLGSGSSGAGSIGGGVIGGGNTGGGNTGGGGIIGSGGATGGDTGGSGNATGAPTTNVEVLKAALRGVGFSASIIDSSTSFLNGLLRDGLDYDNATEIFLNSKEYTLKNGQKITSPFYTEYGYLNEGLTIPKGANELFNTVEGFKSVVEKYKLSSKYLTQDALKSYVKNDVTVADLAERAGTAQLRALEADPFQVDALIKQGFIASAADLADFYLDPKIGKEQLELNRQTGVFTAEALRRTKSGISTSAGQLSGFKQLTATLAAKGYSEAQIAQLAGTGFENIAQTLQPTTQLAQIYEKAGGTAEANAALTEDIQKSLLQEEFMGTASERRKRLSEQNVRAFQGSAGTTAGSLRQANVLGIL